MGLEYTVGTGLRQFPLEFPRCEKENMGQCEKARIAPLKFFFNRANILMPKRNGCGACKLKESCLLLLVLVL